MTTPATRSQAIESVVVPHLSASRAAILMAVSTSLFALAAVTLRLATQHVSSFEAALFRCIFGLIFTLPLLARPAFALPRTKDLHLYLWRGISATGAMLCSFWALAHLPLAQAVSIAYSTPLFVTIGAVFALGEVVNARRWGVVVIGFLGVLIIMRPDSSRFSRDMLIALAGAAFLASSYISVKLIARSEPSDAAVVVYMTLIMTPLSLLFALTDWSWPNATGWLWLALTGLFATVGQLLMTRAYRGGDVSALIPISFIQLPIVSVFSYFLFGQSVDTTTVIGAGIIVAASIYVSRNGAALAKQKSGDSEFVTQN